MIVLNCPRCRRTIEVSDFLAGLAIVCTSCKQPINVPRSDPQSDGTIDKNPVDEPSHTLDAARGSGDSAPNGGPRFRILRLHAKGGLGLVSVAHDVELNREVALKEIQEHRADDKDSRSRFLVEAEITGRLEHPGIVPVYALGRSEDGRPFYAMRLIKGDSLKDVLDRFHKARDYGREPTEQSLELRQLLARFIAVCQTIQYAHDRGVLHRDLKPSNIMLGKYGETLVVDWGIAKALGRADTALGRADTAAEEPAIEPSAVGVQTIAGSAIGTPQYMSPEQAAGRLDQVSPASDVYSLGATLYSVLTGEAPIMEGALVDMLDRVKNGEVIRPRIHKPAVDPALEAICLKAMSIAPADRYASPRALADDLELWLADKPVAAWREPWTVRARRWIAAHRAFMTGLAAAALVGVVSLAIASALLSSANDANKALAEKESKARGDADERREAAELAALRVPFEVYHGGAPQDSATAVLGMATLAPKAALLKDQKFLESIRWHLGAWAKDLHRASPPVKFDDPIHTIGFNADQSRVLAHTLAGSFVVLDTSTWKPVAPELQDVKVYIHAAVFSPDGKTLATSDLENGAQLRDIATGKPLGPPLTHKEQVSVIAFHPSGKMLVTGANDKTFRVWDVATYQPIGPPLSVSGSALAAAFNSDGSILATAVSTLKGEVVLWDFETKKPIGPKIPHESPGGIEFNLALSSDGNTLFIASGNSAHLWKTKTGERLGGPLNHRDWILHAALSKDGSLVVTGCNDRSSQIWDALTGQPVGPPVRGLGFVTIDGDNQSLRIRGQRWDISRHDPCLRTMTHPTAVVRIAFSPNGKSIATSSDMVVRLWDPHTGKLIVAPLQFRGYVFGLAYSPDGTKLLTGCRDKTARIWDVATGKPLTPPMKHDGDIDSVAFSPNGKFVATGGYNNKACLWNATTGEPIGVPFAFEAAVSHVDFSPDSKMLVATSHGATAQILSTATALPIGPPLKHKHVVQTGVFSPDGKHVLTGSVDEVARVWDVATGTEVGAPLHQAGMAQAIYSPDGKSILTFSETIARLWDAQTREALAPPLRHDKHIGSAAFSADGKLIATASADHTAKLWETATGKQLGPALRHQKIAWGVAFSPDGKTLLTGSDDGAARLWKIPEPLAGAPERLLLWAQTTTGMEIDRFGAAVDMDADLWHDRMRQLEKLGGPPIR